MNAVHFDTPAASSRPWMDDCLEIRLRGSTPVTVEVAGELDVCTYPALGRVLDHLEASSTECVILDLGHVALIDSAAARWLHRRRDEMQRRGIDLSVRRVDPAVHRVLAILKMDALLRTLPDFWQSV